MDKIDQLLLDAWNRISKKVRDDRLQALKRSRRRFRGVLTRPLRPWCLVIRASDTRINRWHGAIFDEIAETHGEAHDLTIPAEVIRRLTKPIHIPWPGVTYEEAARICGRQYKTMKTWARQGMFRIDYYREFGFPELPHREPIDASSGQPRRGRGGRPYVWTPSPIDPNMTKGRAPDPAWGTLWQWQWEKLPDSYELTARREPRICRRRGKKVHRGWEFICPGRMSQDGAWQVCGRRATYLYGPQSIWTLPKALGIEVGFELPDDCGLAGAWYPGVSETVAAPGTRSFACRTCWRMRSPCMALTEGWNEFVSQMSGGLLYGHEVPRPLDISPMTRKTRPRRKFTWSAERRARYQLKHAGLRDDPGRGEGEDGGLAAKAG